MSRPEAIGSYPYTAIPDLLSDRIEVHQLCPVLGHRLPVPRLALDHHPLSRHEAGTANPRFVEALMWRRTPEPTVNEDEAPTGLRAHPSCNSELAD